MKTVVITGAAGALGKGVLQKFLQEGYRVIATVRNEAERAQLTEQANLHIQMIDLSSEEATASYFQQAISEYGSIDAALLLAGGYLYGGIEQTGRAEIEGQLSINFYTAYNVAKPIFRHMMDKGSGRIVFMGAQLPLVPQRAKSSMAYSLSKSLIFRLAEMLNEEAKGTNVVAAVVAPSLIDTPANRAAMPDSNHDNWVKVEDIAGVLTFLCSDQAGTLREPVIKVYGNAG
jgi:NAD(P)-dependent dehydrogenase (short-subunit alcohol dehydrogenase family)